MSHPRLLGSALAIICALALGSAPAAGAQSTQDTCLNIDPCAAGRSVTDQISLAHDGNAPSGPAAPFRQRWSRAIGDAILEPLIADGKVFVYTLDADRSSPRLWAFDAENGRTLWSRYSPGTAYTYEAGRLFTSGGPAGVVALDANTGAVAWRNPEVGGTTLVAAGGIVYTGWVKALSASDGHVIWSGFGDGSRTPLVRGNLVIYGGGCGKTTAFNRFTGAIAWKHDETCYGVPSHPVAHGGRVYLTDAVRGPTDEWGDNASVDLATGGARTLLPAGGRPALAGDIGLFPRGQKVHAVRLSTNQELWSADIVTSRHPPVTLFSGGSAVVWRADGDLAALDPETGAVRWAGDVGSIGGYLDGGTYPGELAAGEGIIAVPTAGRLVVLESASETPPPVTVDNGYAETHDASPSLAGVPDPSPGPLPASSHLVDAGHTSSLNSAAVRPPLRIAWSRSFGPTGRFDPSPIVQAVPANGRTFVTVAAGSARTLYALDNDDGSVLWTAPLGGNGVAVAGATVFASGTGGTLRALNAATGEERWVNPDPRNGGAHEAPVVSDGRVIVHSAERLRAVDAMTGQTLWTSVDTDAWDPMPSIGSGWAVVDGYDIGSYNMQTGAFRRLEWGIGGLEDAPAVSGGRAFVNGTIHDLSTNAKIDYYEAENREPALLGNLMLYQDGRALVAEDVVTREPHWHFEPGREEYLFGPPMIAGRLALFTTGGAYGGTYRLHVADLVTGEVVWEMEFPESPGRPTIANLGDDLYVVSVHDTLHALRHDPDAKPDTYIDRAPTAAVNPVTADFEYSSTWTRASFECRLDGSGWQVCPRDGLKLTGLGHGDHVLEVRSSYADFGTDPTPARWAWNVDAVPPTMRIVEKPPELDQFRNVNFRFEASEPGSIHCRLDGGEWWSCGTAEYLRDLSDRTHLLEVRAVDKVGNTGLPASHEWTVDSTPPQTRFTDGPTVTGDTVTASFEAPGAARFDCSLDSEGWAPCASPYRRGSLSGGTHVLRIRAEDAAGNREGDPAQRTFVVATPPGGTPPPADPAARWQELASVASRRTIAALQRRGRGARGPDLRVSLALAPGDSGRLTASIRLQPRRGEREVSRAMGSSAGGRVDLRFRFDSAFMRLLRGRSPLKVAVSTRWTALPQAGSRGAAGSFAWPARRRR